MEPNEVLRAVRSRWWVVIAGLLVGLAAASGVSKAMTPQYSSESRLFVSAASADPTVAYDVSLLSAGRIASYSEILTSQTLASRVVDTLALPMTPAQLAKEISVTSVPDTVILDVTVKDSSPTRARDIAVALDNAFVAQVTALESAPAATAPAATTPGATTPGATTAPIKVSVLQAPQVNTDPVSPNSGLFLGIGAAIGLIGGFLLALVRQRTDHRIRTGQDVVRAAGVDLIGTVRQDPRLTAARPVTVVDERSVSAEAFRGIRTNLQYLEAGRRPKAIVVSSPNAGEGTTTLALNLAAALGCGGNRVLLIEADLRHPTLARKLGLAVGGGLTTVLSGRVPLSGATQSWGDGTVSVLAAGSSHPRPSDLLGSPQMQKLLEEVRDGYDYVLIDAPPLLGATDATVLSVLADACLITARYGRTRTEELTQAVGMLTRLHVRLLGVVLNAVPRRAARGSGLGFAPASSPVAAETEANFVWSAPAQVPHLPRVVVPTSGANGGGGLS